METINIRRIAVLDDHEDALTDVKGSLEGGLGLDVVCIRLEKALLNNLRKKANGEAFARAYLEELAKADARAPLNSIFVDLDWQGLKQSEYFGLHLLGRIRDHKSLRRIPVMIYTGKILREDDVGGWLDNDTPFIRYNVLIRPDKLRKAVNVRYKAAFKVDSRQFVLRKKDAG